MKFYRLNSEKKVPDWQAHFIDGFYFFSLSDTGNYVIMSLNSEILKKFVMYLGNKEF